MEKLNVEMYVSQEKDAYYSIIEKQAIVVASDKKTVCTLNSVGTRIWDLADGSRKIKEIINLIYQEFEADSETVMKDTLEFIGDLIAKHLVRVSKVKKIQRRR